MPLVVCLLPSRRFTKSVRAPQRLRGSGGAMRCGGRERVNGCGALIGWRIDKGPNRALGPTCLHVTVTGRELLGASRDYEIMRRYISKWMRRHEASTPLRGGKR